jgi:hypothetical protein
MKTAIYLAVIVLLAGFVYMTIRSSRETIHYKDRNDK